MAHDEGGRQSLPGSAGRTSLAGVAKNIHNPRNRPTGTEGGADDGESETRDQEGAKEGGLALGEVGMGALGCWRISLDVYPSRLGIKNGKSTHHN